LTTKPGKVVLIDSIPTDITVVHRDNIYRQTCNLATGVNRVETMLHALLFMEEAEIARYSFFFSEVAIKLFD